MPLIHSIESAREETIGRDGVSAAAMRDMLARAGEALAQLRKQHADGSLRLLRLPEERADLAGINPAGRNVPV